MPTYAVTAAFLRLFRKLTKQQRAEFLAARDLFITELRAQGFTPGLRYEFPRGGPSGRLSRTIRRVR